MTEQLPEREVGPEKDESILPPEIKKVWHFHEFPNVTEALNFINRSPEKGPGEIVANTRGGTGQVEMFYWASIFDPEPTP